MEWKNKRIAFLGGDLRLMHTALAFKEEGADCLLWGNQPCGSFPLLAEPADALRSADLAVLGIPVSRDGNTLNAPYADRSLKLTELVELLAPIPRVAMGMAPIRFKEALEEKGCICYDYNTDERFAATNALATAEGALALAIEHSPDTLMGTPCAIMGFGRIGKQLALKLTALGARVTVFARSERDRAIAAVLGCAALPLVELNGEAGRFELIFNTIPLRLPSFPTAQVRGTVIDLAPVYAESDLPKVLRAPSLPFKYAPRASGILIYDCILHRFSSEKEGSV